MHQVFFGVKRVHLLNLKLSREMLREFWRSHRVTPARFDMLRIVHVYDQDGASVAQASIRELLGVSGATVSRMLKALEELGYIVRERKKWQGLHVGFTTLGRELVKRLMADYIEGDGGIDTVLEEMVDPDGDPENDTLTAFDQLLLSFREAHEDPARFAHPWRCGGLDVEWKPHRGHYGDREWCPVSAHAS